MTFVRFGLVPKAPRAREPTDTARHNLILDHADEGLPNVISVLGVKYTTARYVAEKAVDLAARRLGRTLRPAQSAETPLHGGDMASFDALVEDITATRPGSLSSAVLRQLADSYGSEYRQVLRHTAAEPRLAVRPLALTQTSSARKSLMRSKRKWRHASVMWCFGAPRLRLPAIPVTTA